MSTFYSDHFSPAVGQTGHFTTLNSSVVPIPAGKGGGRLRKKTAYITVPADTDLGSGDIIRVMDFKSGDRIFDLRASMDADWGATTTFKIGLLKKGANNDGTTIASSSDAIFEDSVDWSGAITRVDYFTGNSLSNFHRGRQLWELINIQNASTYSSDPFETWTLALTTTQNISATASGQSVEMMVEVDYQAGD